MGEEVLLRNWQIIKVLPCLAEPGKIRIVAELSEDIRQVMPYLNARLKRAVYNHEGGTITFTQDGVMVTLHPKMAYVAKLKDEQAAMAFMDQLNGLINETYRRRSAIEPDTSRHSSLHALDVYKLLPGSNCGKCGEPSCLAFSLKLVNEKTTIHRCSPLMDTKNIQRRRILVELLRNSGYWVPEHLHDDKD